MTLDLSPGLLSDRGTFVISLDFELYWGIIDQLELTSDFKDVLLHTRAYVIPKLLEMFQQYDVHATWATVGLLLFNNKNELLAGLPQCQTSYTEPSLSAYTHIPSVGLDEQVDPFRFAPTLVQQIQSYPHQEIGTHSFSHYYCLEDGQSPEMFRADLQAWNDIAQQFGIKANSICFARNQYAQPYIDICQELGIYAYRGNENVWFYRPSSYQHESISRKIFRWVDTYLPITRHQCTSLSQISTQPLYNIQSSRFLRAYYKKLSLLEPLKTQRILSGMTYAAKQNKIYHLWWHPQDFGEHTQKNFLRLERILAHYSELRQRYQMCSQNMSELVSAIGDSHQ